MNTIELTLESYRCHGEEKLKRPACLKGLKPVWQLPTIATMTYWLSDRGEVYGCQRMKSMCLTKPIRVESRHLGMHPWREEKTVSAFVERR